MFGKDFLLSKANDIAKKLNFDQYQVNINTFNNNLSRFSNNYIHQNISEKNIEIYLKVIHDDKSAIISFSSLDENIIDKNISKLNEIIKLKNKEKDIINLPSKQEYLNLNSYDSETDKFLPSQRGEIVKYICDSCNNRNLNAYGYLSTNASEILILNSNSLEAYNNSTYAELLSIALDKLEGFSYQKSMKISDIDYKKVTNDCIEKSIKCNEYIELDEGEYDVVLENYAVAELLEYLSYDSLNGESIFEESSFFTHKSSHRVFDNNISIYNNPHNTESITIPFDLEGIPTLYTKIIDKGIFKGVVNNLYTANLLNEKSTGNCFSLYYNTPFPLNITLEKGNNTIDEMVNSIEKGIYITKLNYINTISPRQSLYTGLTRGGTFLIENGKITKSIHNLRFTDSFVKVLNNITMLENKNYLFGGDILPNIYVPSVKTKMKFTGVSL